MIGGAATITFDPTVFAAPQTITLTGGQLELSDTGGLETITGPAAGLTIDAGGKSRVFQVDSGVTAALSGLTITGGSASARRRPGKPRHGHAHRLHDQRQLRRQRRRPVRTTARRRSPIVRSAATPPTCGGGVNAYGPLTLTACTVSGNSATEGGGVFLASRPDSRTTIGDTIVAGNAAITSPDLFGTVDQDRGYNLIGDGDGAGGFTAAGDQVGTAASPIDPRLAPLGDYGGPTQTMALRTGSPAIGQGTTVAGLTTDQRGFALDAPRPDIGAFQSNPLVVNTTSDGVRLAAGDPRACDRRSTWPT